MSRLLAAESLDVVRLKLSRPVPVHRLISSSSSRSSRLSTSTRTASGARFLVDGEADFCREGQELEFAELGGIWPRVFDNMACTNDKEVMSLRFVSL